jgi:hypothetical protein
MKITVTRPFYLAGQPLVLDAIVEVDDRLARELIHNGKARAAEALPAPGPMTQKPLRRAKAAAPEQAPVAELAAEPEAA